MLTGMINSDSMNAHQLSDNAVINGSVILFQSPLNSLTQDTTNDKTSS